MNDTHVDLTANDGPPELQPYYRCRHCVRPIEWFVPPGGSSPSVGRGYGWWFHPDRVDLDEPGVWCDLDDDIDTEAEPVVDIVEIECMNDHVWVPGTSVLNSAGESTGYVLSEKMCPVCGDDGRQAVYYEPVVFNARSERAEHDAWAISERQL